MNAAKREKFEIWIGAVIAVALIVLVSLIFSPARLGAGSYEITARFSRADGIRTGSVVRAAGVEVGQIQELELDKDFRAVAVLRINSRVVLDSDATASIVTDGLFGAKFVQLDVGAGDGIIGNGQEIAFTQDSLVLDDLLELIISRARQARRSAGGGAKETER